MITYYRYQYRAYTKWERVKIWWQNFKYHLRRAFFESMPPAGTRDLVKCEKKDAQMEMISDPDAPRFTLVNGEWKMVK